MQRREKLNAMFAECADLRNKTHYSLGFSLILHKVCQSLRAIFCVGIYR